MIWFIVAAILLFLIIRYFSSRPQTISGDFESKIVLITGCDSGFGHASALNFDKLGFQVVACCLDEHSQGALTLKKQSSNRLKIVQLDVTNDTQIKRCHEFVSASYPGCDFWALINNAALTTYFSEVEQTPIAIIRKIYEVNLIGAIKMINTFLPLLKKSKGRIVNISSISTKLNIKALSAYSSSKSALETFSDSLRLELKPYGVDVVIIQPSGFKSVSLDERVLEERYAETRRELEKELESRHVMHDKEAILKRLERSNHRFRQKAIASCNKDFDSVVSVFQEAVISRSPSPRYPVGRGALLIIILSSVLPTCLVDKLET